MKENSLPKTNLTSSKDENLKLLKIEQELINAGIISQKRLITKSNEKNKLIKIRKKILKDKISNNIIQKENTQKINLTSNRSFNKINNISVNIINNLPKKSTQKNSLKKHKTSKSVNLKNIMNNNYKNSISEAISNYDADDRNSFLYPKTINKNGNGDNFIDEKSKHFNYAKWNKIIVNTIFDKDDNSNNFKDKYNYRNINKFNRNQCKSSERILTDINEIPKIYRHKTIDNIKNNDNNNLKRKSCNLLLDKNNSDNQIKKKKNLSNKKITTKKQIKLEKNDLKNSNNTKPFRKKINNNFITSISGENSKITKQFNKNNTQENDLKLNKIITKQNYEKNKNNNNNNNNNMCLTTNYIFDNKTEDSTESNLNLQSTFNTFYSFYNSDIKNNNIDNSKIKTSPVFRKKITGCADIRNLKKSNLDNYYSTFFKEKNYKINNPKILNLIEVEKENENSANDKYYNTCKEDNNLFKLEYNDLEKICLSQERIITDLLNNVQILNYQISDKDQHINELNNQLHTIKTDLINTLNKSNTQ